MNTDGRTPYPADVRAALERAAAGDATALPALAEAFAQHPELVDHFGDLARHAETALLDLAAGSSLVARQAAALHVQALRERLLDGAQSELERVLAGRVALDWLWVHAAEVALLDLLGGGAAGPAVRAAQQRLDAAHARLLGASRALATVIKLLRRGPSPLQMLAAGETPLPAERAGLRSRSAALPVGRG